LSKIKNLNFELYVKSWVPTRLTLPTLIKIGQKVADIRRFNGFENVSCLPSCIFEIQFFFLVGAVKIPILHQRTKFRKYPSHCCRDIAIFLIFKMAAAAIFDFQKFEILTVDLLYGANVRQISSKWVERFQRYSDLTVFFQNIRRPLSCICCAPIGITRDDHLVVSLVVKKIGSIRCASFDDIKLSIFCPFGLSSSVSKSCYYHIRQLRCIRPYLDTETFSTIATSIVHSKLDYCNSLYHNLSKSQITWLQQIQNSLARQSSQIQSHHCHPLVSTLAKDK